MIPVVMSTNCQFSNCAAFKDRIVFFSLGGFCSHAYKAWAVQQCGGVGAIFGQPSFVPPSWDSMANDQDYAPLLRIPLVFVGIEVFQYINQQLTLLPQSGLSLVVSLTYQADPCHDFFVSAGGKFVFALFCVWFAICAVLAMTKLLLFIKEQGLKFNVPQFCLMTTFAFCVIQAVAITINWFGYRNSTSQLTMVVFRDFSWCLFFIPAIAFPFYWAELVRSSKPVTGLKQSRIPLFLCCFIVVGFTLAIAVFKGLWGSNPDAIRAQIITIVILFGLAGCFFVFQGFRVLYVLSKMQEGKLAVTSVQRKTTILFVGLGVLLFGVAIDVSCFFAPSLGGFQDILAANVRLIYYFFIV